MLNNPYVLQAVILEQHQNRLNEAEYWRLCRQAQQGQARGISQTGLGLWLGVRPWSARVQIWPRIAMSKGQTDQATL